MVYPSVCYGVSIVSQPKKLPSTLHVVPCNPQAFGLVAWENKGQIKLSPFNLSPTWAVIDKIKTDDKSLC